MEKNSYLFSVMQEVMHLIAEQFGNQCEVVLHDWSNGYEKTIVAIENGHVSGRKVGDCGSNLGLEVMRGTSDGMNQFNYITKTKTGRTLRSSSLYLKNERGEKIGALCINYDITDLVAAQNTVANLTMTEKMGEEHFASDVNDLLDYLLAESVRVIGKPIEDMTKEDKQKALKYLDEKGGLLITKSGNKICKFFGISKFTMYNYLEETRGNG